MLYNNSQNLQNIYKIKNKTYFCKILKKYEVFQKSFEKSYKYDFKSYDEQPTYDLLSKF